MCSVECGGVEMCGVVVGVVLTCDATRSCGGGVENGGVEKHRLLVGLLALVFPQWHRLYAALSLGHKSASHSGHNSAQ